MLTSQQQQEQLQALLAKLGTDLSLSAVPVLPPPLQAWLAQVLLSNSKDDIKDKQPAHDDTTQPPDQASRKPISNSMPSWLQPTSQDEQLELAEAQAQEVILRQQLQDLQKLDRDLGERQQELERDKQHALQRVREKQDSVATQHRDLQELDAQISQRLQKLQTALEEAVGLITKQGSSWLLVAADMSAYQRAEEAYKQALLQLCEKMRWQHPAYQPSQLDDSHMRSSITVHADDVGLPKEVTPAILTELQRLRHAFLLGELEHIHAKTKLTSLQAQVATVKQMLQEQSAHGYVPWLNENECLRMDATVAELKKDVKKLRGALSDCVDKLSQFQDLPVLKGAFEMSAAHTKTVIRNSEAVIGGLLHWGAQAVLLNQLRSSEVKRLQDLHAMIDKLSTTLADVYNAAEARALACRKTLDAAEGLSDDTASKHAQQTQAASPAARYNTVRQNQQQRQQVEDGSFIDTLHSMLQDTIANTSGRSGNNALACAQAAATVKSVVNAMQQLRSNLNTATTSMTELSEKSIPSVISAATTSAETTQEMLCGPYGDASITPLMERPELRTMIQDAQSVNDKLLNEVNALSANFNAYLTYDGARPEQAALERAVLHMFHLSPQTLMEAIDRLEKRKDALKVAKGLQ